MKPKSDIATSSMEHVHLHICLLLNEINLEVILRYSYQMRCQFLKIDKFNLNNQFIAHENLVRNYYMLR